MVPGTNPVQPYRKSGSKWPLPLLITGGILIPLLGTLYLGNAFPEWAAASLPIHSTFEVSGAAFGIVLALALLFSRQGACNTRRLLVACALLSMGVLDIFHSCVPASQSFVWLHSIAVLAGGIFLAGGWLPQRTISRQTTLLGTLAVLAGATLIGTLSIRYRNQLPAMIMDGKFTTLAKAINLTGGWLTILGGVAFAWFYHRRRHVEDIVFLLICFLFGTAALLFQTSDIWHAGWWFWHALRLAGYLLPLWLAVFAYRSEEEKNIKNQARLALAIAKGDYSKEIVPQHAHDELGHALYDMSAALRKNRRQLEEQDWLKTGLSRLDDALRGDPDAETLASRVIREIATRLEAPLGAFYITDPDHHHALSLFGSYAFSARKNLSSHFEPGEGLVGQAARERKQILIKNIPEDYIRISSQLGECTPRFISVTPFLYEGEIKGVVEIATFNEFSALQLEYLSKACDALGIAVQSAQSRSLLSKSLKQSQALTEELQTQQEALKTANEELEEQTRALQQSEEELKTQQEELQLTNQELEEKTENLERQKQVLKNASRELEEKAAELARNSRYKSEFLANMSHELRTPLNSLLILAGSLAENSSGNLTDDQIESINIVHGSGKDLLSLINEILDLSKIEAGQMDLQIEPFPLRKLADDIERGFKPLFQRRKLKFDIVIDKSAPFVINSDAKRIGQILKNLISNAAKFTHQGGVTVRFNSGDLSGKPCLVCAVEDTGTGIPPEKQKVIFEAFQQADGSITRKYGGTGLGLSISRELTRILGGKIRLKSEEGKGSVFSVSLPVNLDPAAEEQPAGSPPETPEPCPLSGSAIQEAAATALPAYGSVPDDRNTLGQHDKVILIIEDDATFANILLRQCHEKQLQALIASSGEEGLYLAEKYLPSAVVLDLNLPGINGWSVLEQLKEKVETRHIPVHIMSASDPSAQALSSGAIGFLSKPLEKQELDKAFERIETFLERKMKDLLVIEDDEKLRSAILKLIGNGDVHGVGTGTGKEALDMLRAKPYDCIILDLNLPDMSGFELLKTVEQDERVTLPPVIVYTGRELTREEETKLATYSDSIIVKGVRSRERLFDEASLFLHRMVERMPEKKRQMITNLHDSDQMLKDKTVLIVDDDMRNLFALSSALSAKGIKPIKAQDGQKALDMLNAHPETDLVLMDIMMPVMDGYETMAAIRAEKKWGKLPIIALTAKAMKDDRRKCIEAGADDYLPKPVDMSRLLSMMRVWMYR
jgi:signal transduction histidine kinase/CheY-like chemotaxis protein